MRRGRDDRLLHRTPYAEAERRWGAPYLQFSRTDLQALLRDAACEAGAELRLGSPVAKATPQGRITFASGLSESADIVAAADGVRSPVAAALFAKPARFRSGRSAWRALIPADRLPPSLLAPLTQVRIGAGRHLVTYPLEGGARLNLVAVTSGAAADSWSERGEAAVLGELFGGWAEPVPTLLAALDDLTLWRGALHDAAPRRRWTAGRVALLGDAAHPMSPSFAQGAAMAVEDAVALARAVRSGADVSGALDGYARSRRARVAWVQSRSRLNGLMFHLPAPVSSALFRIAARLDRREPLARFDRLYGGGPAAVAPDETMR